MTAHSVSPPPRKRMMLAGALQTGNGAESGKIRGQGMLEMLEQPLSQLSRPRRHHSDPGACVLKMQQQSRLPSNAAQQQGGLPGVFQLGAAFQGQPQPTHAAAAAASSSVVVIPMMPAAEPVMGQQQLHAAAAGGSGGKLLSSKRERTSNGGEAAAASSEAGAGAPPSFTITVDCRAAAAAADSTATATALWQRMHMLEIRNKELEQQLVEQMQAAQISSSSTSARQPRSAGALPPSAAQQLDRAGAAGSLVSPRAHAELLQAEAPVAMDIEVSTSAAAAAGAGELPCSVSGDPSQDQQLRQQHQQQQQQQPAGIGSLQQQGDAGVLQGQPQPQQQPQDGDDAAPQQLVYSLRQQVQKLQKDLQRQQQLNIMLTSDNADLEAVLKETERQRREFAARYAFMTLDTDGDGYVSVEQVLTYDLFSCYAPPVLMAAFNVWRWDSGFPGYLCMDDFVRFVEYAEDRSTRESQRFWFSVMDADGDGRLSWADMKLLYDAVQQSCTAGGILLHFEDLMNQVRDMVARQRHPSRGFTAQELWESKLGAGVIGLLTNANNMLLQRSTAEWGRGDFPL